MDHYTAEASAHVAKIGIRFAALQPVVMTRSSTASAAWAPTWPGHRSPPRPRGPQYRSGHFLGSIGWLGITDDAAFRGEPETNGFAERWIRTFKDQCLWADLHDSVDELRKAMAGFVPVLQPGG
jgi:transposase InsO family protein